MLAACWGGRARGGHVFWAVAELAPWSHTRLECCLHLWPARPPWMSYVNQPCGFSFFFCTMEAVTLASKDGGRAQ